MRLVKLLSLLTLCVSCSSSSLPPTEESDGSDEDCLTVWDGECAGVKRGTSECESSFAVVFDDGVQFSCTEDGADFDCSGAEEAAEQRCDELSEDDNVGVSTGGQEQDGSGGSQTGGTSPRETGGSTSSGGSEQDSSGGMNSGGSGGTSLESGGSGGEAGCTPVPWCNDADGDGYLNPDDCVDSCLAPGPPYTYRQPALSNGDDCYDNNANARPNLESWQFFSEDRGDGSFDYDCSGSAESEFLLGSCLQHNQEDVEGWVGSIPECGDAGALVIFDVDGNCSVGDVSTVARCR